MDEITFREESEEEADLARAEEEKAAEEKPKVHKYCSTNIWEAGWKMIDEMDVRGVRTAARDRIRRKREFAAYILNKVRSMQEEIASVEIEEDAPVTLEAPRRSYVHKHR